MEPTSRGRVSGGRVVLPAGLRKQFGIEDGTEIVFGRTGNGDEAKSLAEFVSQAQVSFARLVGPGESVVDELIRDRRKAAGQE